MNRPSWDHTWMTMARELAKRSHDPTYRVGALVVTRENTQVLSLGYNGNAPGLPHERESMAPGESGFIHAEVNALIKLDFNNPAKKVMYVTLSPCRMCAKLIMAAKVEEVVYADKYRDLGGVELLERSGVEIRQYVQEETASHRACIQCKKNPAVSGGRFCGAKCAAAYEPEQEVITGAVHPLRTIVTLDSDFKVLEKTFYDEKSAEVRNPSGKCWNCGRSTSSHVNGGDATKNRYCSLDCADEDGACSK